MPIDGTFYSGNYSTTESGKTCIRWNETNYRYDWVQEGHNFCRNPDYGKAFCLVACPSCERRPYQREYCNILPCLTKERAEEVGCQKRGTIYAGKANYTIRGHDCQKWTAKTPHYSGYPEEGDHNYCRNPNGQSTGLWCYTTDPQVGWSSCYVPNCETMSVHDIDCAPIGTSAYYGTKNTTRSGRKCQMWSDDTPHWRSNGIRNSYNGGTYDWFWELNYCRNPYGDPLGPWCYTKDPTVKAERCEIPSCGTYTKGKASCAQSLPDKTSPLGKF